MNKTEKKKRKSECDRKTSGFFTFRSLASLSLGRRIKRSAFVCDGASNDLPDTDGLSRCRTSRGCAPRRAKIMKFPIRRRKR